MGLGFLRFSIGLFAISYVLYVGTFFMPKDATVQYAPQYVLHTNQLPHKSYDTPFDRQVVYLDYYTISTFYTAVRSIDADYVAIFQLCLLVGLIIVLLAVSTYLSGYWFWLFQAFFAVFLYGFNIDHLRLFNRLDHLPYVALLAIFTLTIWHIHRKSQAHRSLLHRIGTLSALTVLVALAIHYLSAERAPFSLLAQQIYYPKLCVTLLFCLALGHAIPSFLLYLSSTSGFGRSGYQFVTVFALYMTHLVFFFLDNTGYADFTLYYLDEFVFFALSTLIGIWGVHTKAQQTSPLLPYPLQRLTYLLVGAFALFTITSFHIHGNDPALEVVEDSILFGHIGFGIGFFIYVLMNFRKPLFTNLEVWRVVYKDVDTPFLVVRLFGVICLIVCSSLSNNASYYQAIAGEYVEQGRSHTEQRPALAQHYYEQAAAYGYQSHAPNYALGQLSEEQNNPNKAIVYYKAAIAKHPSPQAYLNLGSALQSLQLHEQAAEIWHQGLKVFPEHKHLATNLSFYHLYRKNWDSLRYYATLGAKVDGINAQAAAALRGSSLGINTAASSETPIAEATNHLALLAHQKAPIPFPLAAPTHESDQKLPYLYNYALALTRSEPNRMLEDSALYRKIVETSSLEENMLYLRACAAETVGDYDTALRLLSQLEATSRHASYYAYLAGVWAYAAGGYSRAEQDLLRAYAANYQPALSVGVQSLSMLPASAHRRRQIEAWESLKADTSALWDKWIRKSTFLEVSKDHISAQMLSKMLPNHEFGLALVQRLLNEEKGHLATQLMSLLSPPLDTNKLLKWSLLQEECRFATSSGANALQKPTSSLPHAHYFTYLQSPDILTTHNLLEAAKKSPFQQWFLLRSAAALQANQANTEAYELLLSAIETNRHAPMLQKAYVLQSLRMGYVKYAEYGLLILRDLLSKAAYEAFQADFSDLQREMIIEEEKWDK